MKVVKIPKSKIKTYTGNTFSSGVIKKSLKKNQKSDSVLNLKSPGVKSYSGGDKVVMFSSKK